MKIMDDSEGYKEIQIGDDYYDNPYASTSKQLSIKKFGVKRTSKIDKQNLHIPNLKDRLHQSLHYDSHT